VCKKLPSQKSSTSSPATAPEKDWCLVDEGDYSSSFPGNDARKRAWLLVDGARKELVAYSWMTSPLGTPRGRCDEYSSKIFPQLRNQGLSVKRGETNDWRWCLQASRQLRTIYMAPRPSFALRVAMWNLHTHNQVLCSQLAMRLSISPVCLKQMVWAYRVESDNSMRVK
jgi:hypothetical protein